MLYLIKRTVTTGDDFSETTTYHGWGTANAPFPNSPLAKQTIQSMYRTELVALRGTAEVTNENEEQQTYFYKDGTGAYWVGFKLFRISLS